MRIGFFGQSPFGAAVYERLRETGHEIVGVYGPPETKRADPVADLARRDGVALLQPKRWQQKGAVNEEVYAQYVATKPDLNVMAFVTQIIPARVLEYPAHDTIQYHPSLLPRHRGRSAINYALLQGESEAGLTIFWVDQGLDTGPILLQKRFPIGENDTVNSIYRERFFPVGVDALVEAVRLVADGSAPRIVQDETEATYEAPWEGDIARIDWTQPSRTVHNLIRGSDRQPGAWTTLAGKTVKFYGSCVVSGASESPGMVTGIDDNGVTIQCGDAAAVRIETAMPDGAKRTSAYEWATEASVKQGTTCE